MNQTPTVPRVAFVINLAGAGSHEANTARLRHLARLFHGHDLPATWLVDDAKRASLLPAQQFSAATHQLALTIDQQWCRQSSSHARFRAELVSRIEALDAASGTTTNLVVGDPHLLCTRAAVLAEQGIGGVLSERQERLPSAKPRPLPCGLWQLQPSLRIPQQRRFAGLLFGRRPAVKQLMAGGTSDTTLVSVESAELVQASARSLRHFEKLLREISWAKSRNQLIVTTVAEVLAELVRQRIARPQRSILRVAA